MRITLVYAPAPRTVHELVIDTTEGATVQQALAEAGWAQRFPECLERSLGVWGRQADLSTVLQDGDRLEVYRGLRVDPKTARRERFVGQGARTTGLFNRRRPGSKAGY
jgi:putative ubiquitin-RnfH superfamily antitoxin RatB of RatAB toxin-antitoxin module